MFCSISGSVPEEPVINKNSGLLFEKRLIEKHVQETGKDPITGEALLLDDLVAVKTNKAAKPRTSPATSIPGLLGLFQNEWDALMLETHQLRTSLGTVRQELSHALYQHDAACRVIARLTRERDQARAEVERVRAAAPAPAEMANGGGAEAAEEQPAKRAKAGITEDIIARMTEHSTVLSKGRKKRAMSATLATAEEITGFGTLGCHPLHKTSKGGILAIDTSPGGDDLVATAGADGSVVLFDRAAGRVRSQLAAHAKRVTGVQFLGSDGALVSCSADRTVKLWSADAEGAFTAAAVFQDHSDEVTAVTVHATGDYIVTASLDRTWAFYDLQAQICLTQVSDPAVEGGLTSAEFHPDGLILGTGTADALVRIWEVRQQKNVAKFEGHKGPVTSLSFSENGYFLATAAADGVKLWDLRKLKNFRTLEMAGAAVAFDHSGLYLAAGGADVRVMGVKQDWSALAQFADLPKKGVLAVKLGADARTLFVGAADHNLRVYGIPTGDAMDAE
ncbi:hypothetical protein WJX81_002866 [Elliptochloris bilobata]|uniref:Pre-mRNA-processing factor 19 n=1 Tax=Elliptochloris bilobata TaxID=381761 RepID=A0AAW1RXU9_9CHLO